MLKFHPTPSALREEPASTTQRPPLLVRPHILVLGVILLGAALRFYGLGDRSLWGDEINTAVLFVSKPMPFIATHFHPNNHTFFSLLARIFTWDGVNEYLLRMPAAILGIASIAAVYWLGTCAFNRGTGLIAAFLLTISPYHLAYSQEARGYAGVVLFATLSMSCLFQDTERRPRRTIVAFVLTTLLLLYTHLFSILLLAVELCLLAGSFLIRRLSKPQVGPVAASQVRSWILGLLVLGVLLALLYAPLWLSLLSVIDKSYAGDYAGSLGYSTDWRLDVASLQKLFLQFAGSQTGSWQALSLISLGFFLFGFVQAAIRRPKHGFALASLLVLPFLLVAVLTRLLSGFYAYSRFFIFLLPVYLVIVAFGIESSGELVWRLTGRRLGPRLPAWGISLLLAVSLFGSLSNSPLQRVYATEYQGWREVGQYLAQSTQAGDLVVQLWLLQPNSLAWYYHPDPGVEVRLFGGARSLTPEAWPGRDVWWVLVHDGQVWRLERTLGDEFEIRTFAWLAVLHRRGDVTSREEFLDATAKLLEQQGDISPTYRAIYSDSARELLQAGGFELARVYAERGNQLADKGAWSPAALEYERATVCWPIWGLPYTKLGNAYRALGRLSDAESSYRRSIQVEPSYVGAYINLADTVLAQDRTEEALALYTEAKAVAPDSAWAYSALGAAQIRLGDTGEAIAHLRHAVELEPENVTWLLALADGLRELGHVEEAADLYRQVLVLQPENQRANEALQALQP